MTRTIVRHRSADVAVGYAADLGGAGIAYAALATGTGRSVVKVPFSARPLPGLDGREMGYAAVGAVAAYLRGRGFTRVRIRIADAGVVDDLNARTTVPPSLAMPYVKTRCALHGFAVARVERGEPIETQDLDGRARADIGQRGRIAA
ncbi:MAG TPA: hypothetical protein VFB22_04340 [Candidatus Baltobacteraceae bacterium]|nr:hypothetical protein [Candidatus Baltobacteraceae bacterium]